MRVIIKGAGDLASGVAVRLYNCGFEVIMTEIPHPTTVRTTVAFSSALVFGEAVLEGITAQPAKNSQEALDLCRRRIIPILPDEEGKIIGEITFDVLVDAILAKKNLGTKIGQAPTVIALGPGFVAGEDCHAVVETKRGHYLGRVIYRGSAIPNTGIPGDIGGFSAQRIIRCENAGIWLPHKKIGDLTEKGDLLAEVDTGKGKIPVYSAISGVVRGMLFPGTAVTPGFKCGDIDPRGKTEYCLTVSDKARAVGGGVLEAILALRKS